MGFGGYHRAGLLNIAKSLITWLSPLAWRVINQVKEVSKKTVVKIAILQADDVPLLLRTFIVQVWLKRSGSRGGHIFNFSGCTRSWLRYGSCGSLETTTRS